MNNKAYSLAEFSAAIRNHNVARPNLFFLEMTLPPALIDVIPMEELKLVNLMCHSTFSPEIYFHTINNYYEAGQPISRVHGYGQTPSSLYFHMDGSFIVKKFFDRWRRIITNSRNNFMWPDDYTAESYTLSHINVAEEIVYTNKYKRVWPKDIQQMSLHHGSATSMMSLNVTLAYETVEFSSDVLTQETIEQATLREKQASEYLNREFTNSNISGLIGS